MALPEADKLPKNDPQKNDPLALAAKSE